MNTDDQHTIATTRNCGNQCHFVFFVCFVVLVRLVLLLIAAPAFSAIRKHYGGNLKVAEELLDGIRSQQLFEVRESGPVCRFPLPYRIEEESAEIDLASLNPDSVTEIEKNVVALQDPSDKCHWILDYPYYNHEHPTSISVEDGKMTIESTDAEFLQVVLRSSCLVPEAFALTEPFRHTQFGYEANVTCLAGRPFLDSITPVTVDPVNPYLSFKLNEVDVIPVPEDRFGQVSSDPQASILPGPKFFLFLQLANFSPEQASVLAASIRPKELARTVLNDHAEILLSSAGQSGISTSATTRGISYTYPAENPYRLMGERIQIQLQDAGFTFSNSSSRNTPSVQLRVIPFGEYDYDLLRYHFLRTSWSGNSRPWYDIWDELETSRRILPLLIHVSRLAARKSIQGLQTQSSGMPDFANAWLLQEK